MRKPLVALAILAACAASAASATVPLPVPEPGILELVAAGVVAGVIVWVRKRRK